MWSGPRNISTALLRSFSNRDDTFVYDEPFYSYYLKETGFDHPMRDEIIDFYPTSENEVIKTILKDKKGIYYQKHMTHHILDKTNLEWLEKGTNCFLIRHPSKVINSYIKKNKLYSITDIGFDQMFRLFNYIKKNLSKNIIIINADTLLENPEVCIRKLCMNLNIDFSTKMMKWPKGITKDFGIWHTHWYRDIINSTEFIPTKNIIMNVPKKFEKIYKESLNIYEHMNKFSI
tara:strand:+ start:37 stop:732 length:696 start_codon:yes stop_codon:yes gene_type:complete